MDQGRQSFTMRLVPHAGDWRAAGVVRLAAELNQPPFALLESFHDGAAAAGASHAADDGGAVVVTVLTRGPRTAAPPSARTRAPAPPRG